LGPLHGPGVQSPSRTTILSLCFPSRTKRIVRCPRRLGPAPSWSFFVACLRSLVTKSPQVGTSRIHPLSRRLNHRCHQSCSYGECDHRTEREGHVTCLARAFIVRHELYNRAHGSTDCLRGNDTTLIERGVLLSNMGRLQPPHLPSSSLGVHDHGTPNDPSSSACDDADLGSTAVRCSVPCGAATCS
jgi:hypothetical protein